MTNEQLALFMRTWHGLMWNEWVGANAALPESLRVVVVPMEDQMIKGRTFEEVNAGKPLLGLWLLLRQMDDDIRRLLLR